MSRTWKDMPRRLGGNQHRYFCVNSHGSHGKFTRLMRRLARRFFDREVRRDPETAEKRNYHEKMYFD